MRLTCPNCAAEYEIAAHLVPPDGRHVQCTACHTRWFARPAAEPAPAPASAEDEDAILRRLEARPRLVSSVAPVVVPLTPPAAPPPPAEIPEPVDAEEPEETEAQETEAQDAAEPPAAEEAPAEPQTPDDVPAADDEPRGELRPALVPATTEPPQIVNLPAPSGRARLDLTVEPGPAPMTLLPSSRFGHGLVLALVVMALAAAAYLWRAPIAAQVPAAAPALAAYGDLVDDLREALAGAFSGS